MDHHKDIDQLHQNILQSLEISISRQKSFNNLEQSWPPYRRLLKFLSQSTYISSDRLNNYARTIFFLILLGLIFPLHLLITLLTYIFSYSFNLISSKKSTSVVNPHLKRILISGGRTTAALQLSRSLARAGHQIILIDEFSNWLTGHRWSNSVERFYVHPSSTDQPDEYLQTLTNIVRKEKIDLFIPVISSWQIDSKLKSALANYGCSVFHDMTEMEDEYAFIAQARSFDLPIPKTLLFTSRRQLLDFDFDGNDRSFICKSIRSNQSLKLPRTTPIQTIEDINKLWISKDHPYVLQEWIVGTGYSTYAVSIKGELTLFTCSQSSSNQKNYQHIDHLEIIQWYRQYFQASNFTGHISFDFIVNDQDQKPYPIKCNPSINSAITMFYNHPNLSDAYLCRQPSILIKPLITAREIYWFPDEIWRMIVNIRSMNTCVRSVRRILFGKEAIWSWDDPFPFLFHYHIHFFYLLLENLFSKQCRFFYKIDCSLGELV